MDTNEIKKKFLDILFDVEEPQKTEVVSKSSKVLNAKDILYNKSQPLDLDLPKQSTAFIDLDSSKEKKIDQVFMQNNGEKSINETAKREEYVFMSNVSPMFGIIEDDDIKESITSKNLNETKKSQSKQTNYLGTVISPFYGYDFPKQEETVDNSLTNTIKKREAEKPFPERQYDKVKYIEPSFDTLNIQKKDQTLPEFKQVNQAINANVDVSKSEEIIPAFKQQYQEYTDDTKTEEIDLFEDLFGDKD